ncbi:conserved hypothetical protein [Histoplasma capsulatum H143]|uniref:Uncharacterized protein n=1 Tax=Ajellomyces capsulatus (strain H143) TaxID=544712 RepID=C6HKD7_AJECH|nr:conserved hypothetical protein [Histoplasma capsulatum H143]
MFRATAPLSMKYIGIAIDVLKNESGPGYSNTVEAAGKAIEQRVPAITQAKIQGTRPHRSSKDPFDTKEVITVSFHDDKGTRLLSIHAHDDGTWKEYFSRAGRSKSQSRSTFPATEDVTSGDNGENPGSAS